MILHSQFRVPRAGFEPVSAERQCRTDTTQPGETTPIRQTLSRPKPVQIGMSEQRFGDRSVYFAGLGLAWVF